MNTLFLNASRGRFLSQVFIFSQFCHQVAAVGRLERLQALVVNDQQLDLGQSLELFVVTAIGFCLQHRADISHGHQDCAQLTHTELAGTSDLAGSTVVQSGKSA